VVAIAQATLKKSSSRTDSATRFLERSKPVNGGAFGVCNLTDEDRDLLKQARGALPAQLTLGGQALTGGKGIRRS
jgi:hypothetical protein